MPACKETQQLAPEDLLWAGLAFKVLDEEGAARQQAGSGDKVHQHAGVWWRELKYGFCQPSFVYAEVDHRECRPHALRAPTGFLHVAAPGSPSNVVFRTIVRDDVAEYSVQRLGRGERSKVRRALARLEIRPVERLEDLLDAGYEVYASWHGRVRWGADKTRRANFAGWITRVFQQSHRIILGAYQQGQLVAFMLPSVVRQVAFLSFVASHSDVLSAYPNDALYHAFLCIARQTPGVTMVDFAPVSSKPSLDRFKLGYGRVRETPAYLWLNPVIRALAGNRLEQRYPWIGKAA